MSCYENQRSFWGIWGVVARLGTWEKQKIEVILFLLKLVTSMGWWQSHILPPTSTTGANAPLRCTALAKETRATDVCSWRNNRCDRFERWSLEQGESPYKWDSLSLIKTLGNRSDRGRVAAFLQHYIQVLKIVYSTAVSMVWLYVTIQQNGWFQLKLYSRMIDSIYLGWRCPRGLSHGRSRVPMENFGSCQAFGGLSIRNFYN